MYFYTALPGEGAVASSLKMSIHDTDYIAMMVVGRIVSIDSSRKGDGISSTNVTFTDYCLAIVVNISSAVVVYA